MVNVTFPYADPGQASFETLNTYYASIGLITGADPHFELGLPLPMAASQTFKQFQVVGFGGDSLLVPAVYAADGTEIVPIGVVLHAVSSAATGTTNATVSHGGCFNPDILVWDASFDTDEKKLNAFRGAPTPTRIVIKKRL